MPAKRKNTITKETSKPKRKRNRNVTAEEGAGESEIDKKASFFLMTWELYRVCINVCKYVIRLLKANETCNFSQQKVSIFILQIWWLNIHIKSRS